jgi:hypothetical protein
MIDQISATRYHQTQSSTVKADPSAVGGYTRSASQNTNERSTGSSNKTNGQSTKVTLSAEALSLLGASKEKQPAEKEQFSLDSINLTDEELKELATLKKSDREVRAHELAHMMAGGSLVRKGASYQYEMGPDGVRYAVSGEVSIDTSPVEDDPAATIAKMEKVKRAALAPAEPSAQDRSVAASASQIETAARQELNQQSTEEN